MKIHVKEISRRRQLTVFSLSDLNNGVVHGQIGNKASNLIKLFQFGYRIPSSLFLDYSWFEYFLKHDRIIPDLVDHIIKQKLGESLAIRSSSSIEDSPVASRAGFFESSLAIPIDSEQIEHAIRKCYESMLEFQRRRSAEKKKSRSQAMRMGVIIQPTIDAKHSGVLFTTKPQNPVDEHCQIQYSPGTGERLTGSLESGSSVILHKKTGKIIHQDGRLLLPQRELRALGNIAESLESRFHFPQDVEFAISKSTGHIFLLQSRPITAFSFTPEYVIEEEKQKLQQLFRDCKETYDQYPIISSSNISELFSYCTPLGFSIFRAIFAGAADREGAINTGRKYLGYAPITKKEQTRLFLSVGDQARMNLLIDALTFRVDGLDRKVYLSKAVKRYLTLMRRDSEKAIYPEGQVYLQAPEAGDWKRLYGKDWLPCYQVYLSFLKNLTTEKIPTVLESTPAILSKNAALYERELASLPSVLQQSSLATLKKKLCGYLRYLRDEVGVHYVIIARIAFLSTYLVKEELNRVAHLFLPAVRGNRTNSEMNQTNLVEEYFNLLLSDESHPDSLSTPSVAEHIRQVKNGEVSLEQFLNTFGHIGSLDIKEPRLFEIPARMIQSLLDAQVSSSPETSKAKPSRALEFYEEHKSLFPEKTDELREWVRYANSFMMLRETLKLEILKPLYLIKKTAIEMASRLGLNDDLVYYLTCDELEAIGTRKRNEYRLTALVRKAKHKAYSSVEVKYVIDKIARTNLQKKKPLTDVGQNVYELKGRTILHGEAAGACLFASNSKEYYEKLINFRKEGINEIIGVFKGIEPSYCYLSELTGMVTEHGGYLAHAATIAREYNIPYITNVAIDHLRDANHVVLDTSNHKVRFRKH